MRDTRTDGAGADGSFTTFTPSRSQREAVGQVPDRPDVEKLCAVRESEPEPNHASITPTRVRSERGTARTRAV
ncbi:hypothetical protein GCM10010398_16010 [Streptomyces fimbriatus]